MKKTNKHKVRHIKPDWAGPRSQTNSAVMTGLGLSQEDLAYHERTNPAVMTGLGLSQKDPAVMTGLGLSQKDLAYHERTNTTVMTGLGLSPTQLKHMKTNNNN